MDESSNKEIIFLEENLNSNFNLTQVEKSVLGENSDLKEKWLKYHYKFILSLIIFLLFVVDILITKKSILDITKNEQINDKFNLTDFIITNNTCRYEIDIITESDNYHKNINDFYYSRKIIIYLIESALFTSLILMINIYYIKYNYEKGENQNNIILILSFIFCLLLFIIEFLLITTFIYILLRLFDIINFIENNVENTCIIFPSSEYILIILKYLMKMIMVLELLKICNLQILIYFLKQLIILNNFFYFENDDFLIDNDKPEKPFSNIINK